MLPSQFSGAAGRSALSAICLMKRGMPGPTRATSARSARHGGVARQRAQVEIDAGVEQVFRRAVLDPVRKAFAPFRSVRQQAGLPAIIAPLHSG
jgi:hypothetical protein